MENLIACCGLDCAQCEARLATLLEDDTLRAKVAAAWSELNHTEITPEMIHCVGCRVNGVKTPFCESICPIRPCAAERKADTCASCAEMETCARLGMITGNNPSALENLKARRMQLVEPSMEYDAQIQAYRKEFLASGDSMDGSSSLLRYECTKDWLDHTEAMKKPETTPEGLVPATQFLYVRASDRKVVGVIQIRHCLNDFLEKYSGHIGYSVCPSERRKGYAAQMLRRVLPECRALGIGKVLVSCIQENEGSRRTILKNGGVYDSTVYMKERDVYLEKYWIDVPDYTCVTLRDRPDLLGPAAAWFHAKWGVPEKAYLECMAAYLKKETEYGWYLCLLGDRIAGGLGVIQNDFHDRRDLFPNVCAVYTEEAFRGQGIAGRLLQTAVEDLRVKGISPVYLVTDHIGFYERYGWEFLCMAHEDGGTEQTRVYIHR